MLECIDLSTGYTDRTISQHLSFRVPTGNLVTLIGPNGCGKSTLMKTLAALLPPKSGQLRIAGKALESLSPKQLALWRAYLPQIKNIPNITVYSLICHARFSHLGFSRRLSDSDHALVEQAIELAGVDDWRETNMQILSGGQRQRVYLALTLAQDTPLLLWDEPGTFLDIGSRFALMRLAKQLCNSGKTILMTVQELSDALLYSDLICLMTADGALGALDTPDRLAASGLLDRVFGIKVEQSMTVNGKRFYIQPQDRARSITKGRETL